MRIWSRNFHWLLLFLALAACNAATQTNDFAQSEKIRQECIQGRRKICGRVLLVTTNGLVVDSGYTGLLKPPLNHSWVTRSNVEPSRPSVQIESAAPDSIAFGLVFLTDIPRRPRVHQYDYVNLVGYPAGHYEYVPAPHISKTLRRFAGGLETAVTLTQESKP